MSSGPENRFIASIHRLLPSGVYAMKNHNPYNAGIADCWYSTVGGDLWVEYKYLELPKRPDTLVDLCSGKNPPITRLQQEWLKARDQEGRSVCVVIGTADGGIWLPGVSWNTPRRADIMRGLIQSKKSIALAIANR